MIVSASETQKPLVAEDLQVFYSHFSLLLEFLMGGSV